jgi:hypothetical protein
LPRCGQPFIITPSMVGMSFSARAVRFFFMYLGPLVTIVVYFALFGAAGNSMSGLRTALFVALGMQSAYIAAAWVLGEHKQFDFGIWLMFAAGALAACLRCQGRTRARPRRADARLEPRRPSAFRGAAPYIQCSGGRQGVYIGWLPQPGLLLRPIWLLVRRTQVLPWPIWNPEGVRTRCCTRFGD